MRIEVAVKSEISDGNCGAKEERVLLEMQREEFKEIVELRT